MRDARRSLEFYCPAELHEQRRPAVMHEQVRQAASAQEQPRQAVARSELHLVLAKGDVVRSQEKGWKFREEGARFRKIGDGIQEHLVRRFGKKVDWIRENLAHASGK